jgi:hypothetical protein
MKDYHELSNRPKSRLISHKYWFSLSLNPGTNEARNTGGVTQYNSHAFLF